MSIFPSRFCMGDMVIFHAFYNSEGQDCIRNMEAHFIVLDPQGCVVDRQKKRFFLKPLDDEKSQFKGASLHVMLQSIKSKLNLKNFYDNFVNATHFYTTYTIPDNALPGKYELKCLLIENGELSEPWSDEKDAIFFVDSLTIDNTSIQHDEMHVRICNKSSEETPIRIVEFGQDPVHCQTTFMTLKPKMMTNISLSDTQAKLFFCENRKCITLNLDNSPYVLKNYHYKAVLGSSIDKNADTVYLVNEGEDILQLNEQAQNIWEQSNGVTQKSTIYTENNSKTYNQLFNNGIIIEINPSDMN